MTAKLRPRSRARWVRLYLWQKQQSLAPRTRRRIVLGALLLLTLGYLWLLLRGMPGIEIRHIEFPLLNP